MPTRVIGGRYVVLAELGRGGMGIVWRAEDRVMGRHVAVKELHLPAGLPAQERQLFRERLLREARTAGRLNDPGIVTVYDVVTDEGVDHIVMELIEARTLAQVVAESGPLDERDATAIARQLLAALRVAHEGGVVHRDVKPSNVMLAAGGRVKLTDFGIAQAAEDPRLTTTGSLIGSPGFMSPERLESGSASPAGDLWALGATLFHAVQGHGPFDRETTAATISAVLHGDLPTTRTRGPLGSVITGLLQRSPQARLSGMQAEALLASSGEAPAPDVATTPLASAPRRSVRPWLIGIAVALVAGLVGGLVGGFALAGLGDPDVRTLTYGEGGDIGVYDVSFLYCLQVRPDPGQQIASSATVSCDSPHAAEVFGVVETFASSDAVPYPDGLAEFAAAACAMRFDSGLVADREGVVVTALLPSQAEFGRDSGSGSFQDRDVYCLLSSADGASQLTGSRLATS
ncbi:serine/threonine-protein kinase [Pseudonocardia abyssalis]|uniref:non-specific serine/threonine protein kinase n=1 Tax=Pseudonocardia abyssalis TaxID=2792008 RepID=A0ABS6V0Z3_9PSEU|nr:serine/threonine-protein kinase [Pseudonocardia abyssalis]MBW0114495.1 serine/threonine protein kinase [Pseudonocardia abyssalis]MBW0138183.1 serine/threonine protein kinase [Pseudonocardia abyssalis]